MALTTAAVALPIDTASAAGATSPGKSSRIGWSAGPVGLGVGYLRDGGSRRVREVQRSLRCHGFAPGPVDGLFGPRTLAAVRGFQATAGLAVDGIVGRRTLKRLRAGARCQSAGNAGGRARGTREGRGVARTQARDRHGATPAGKPLPRIAPALVRPEGMAAGATDDREIRSTDVWLWLGVLATALVLIAVPATRPRETPPPPGRPLVRQPEPWYRRTAHRPSTTYVRQFAAARGSRPTVSIVIPTLNEAASVPFVLRALPEGVDQVVLVDGGSVDGTIDVARQVRPDIDVVRQRGRGKGDALACGFERSRGDILVTIDADGSNDPAEIPRFIAALLSGAAFAKGSRFMPGAGTSDITWLRRVGNRALGVLVNVLFGTRYTDLCYGYNALWRRCLPDLDLDSAGFEIETLMNIRVAKANLPVTEVPSFEAERIAGHSKLNARRDGMRVLRTIIAERANAGIGRGLARRLSARMKRDAAPPMARFSRGTTVTERKETSDEPRARV